MTDKRTIRTVGGLLAAAALSGLCMIGSDGAGASTPAASAPPPCRPMDVTYWFGQVDSDGQNQVHYDITVVADAGVTCTLSDIPALSFRGPAGQAPIKVATLGTGHALTLTDTTPLHTHVAWHNVDDADDQAFVATQTLRMPGKGTAYPAVFPAGPSGMKPHPTLTAIARNPGIVTYPWQTGIGQGEGEQPAN